MNAIDSEKKSKYYENRHKKWRAFYVYVSPEDDKLVEMAIDSLPMRISLSEFFRHALREKAEKILKK